MCESQRKKKSVNEVIIVRSGRGGGKCCDEFHQDNVFKK
jgi:hypothetical protein